MLRRRRGIEVRSSASRIRSASVVFILVDFNWNSCIGSITCGVVYGLIKEEYTAGTRKAMEYVAKGCSAIQEVDRVIDHCELNDRRLIPLFRGAKENSELALEADNLNTHARYWLSKLHLKYHVPGACRAIGAALLVEAADMGNADAQYELGCRLRVKNIDHVQSDQQAFHYIENAVDRGFFFCQAIIVLEKEIEALQIQMKVKQNWMDLIICGKLLPKQQNTTTL